MSNIPFIVSFGSTPAYYNHDIYPNRIYRRLHPRHHEPLDMHTLGMIARMGAHGHQLAGKSNGELSPLPSTSKDGSFVANLDVGLFQPDELSVKVADDHVVVEAKHEEREDEHGHIFRHLVRRYALPKGYDAEKIVAAVTTDGVLTIHAPKPQITEKGHERVVPIQHTGPSDLFLKSGSKDETEPEKKK